MLLVYQSRKWFESTGRNRPGLVYSRGPSRKRLHSRRENGDPHRHPGIRLRHKDRYRDSEDDHIFPGRHVSIHWHSPIFMTELLNRYEGGETLAGIIYLHRISDNRFGGMTGQNFYMFYKLFGESTLKNVILVTNMWREDPEHINEVREKELSKKYFKPAFDRGAQMVRHYGTTESAHDILRKIVESHPVVLQVQRELADEDKDIIDTAAGESINQELKEQTRRYQAEMMEALKAKDEMRQEATKIRKASEEMAANHAAEIERMTAKMREMEQEAKERERAEVVHKQQLADLDRRLRDETNAFAAYRAKSEQGTKKPQDRVVTAASTPLRQTPYVQDPFSTWPLTMADALEP